MARNLESLEIEFPTLTIRLKLPRLFRFRMWLSVKLIGLANFVSGGFISAEFVADDNDASATAGAS